MNGRKGGLKMLPSKFLGLVLVKIPAENNVNLNMLGVGLID
jgi:hypothetical protein